MPADCAYGQPLHYADNYACDEGLCVYLGCQTDDECIGVGNGEDDFGCVPGE